MRHPYLSLLDSVQGASSEKAGFDFLERSRGVAPIDATLHPVIPPGCVAGAVRGAASSLVRFLNVPMGWGNRGHNDVSYPLYQKAQPRACSRHRYIAAITVGR